MFSLTTIDTDDNQYIVMDRAYGPFQHCLDNQPPKVSEKSIVAD
jgi:hypothetical protein